jgi:O-antigen/teichoic acid export membrane protein
MSENKTLTIAEIKKRAVSSFLSLTARQVLLRAIGFISINVVLARILPVSTLGIFNIATAVISFFAFFSDIGLAASLIQKKEAVTVDDIKTTFTIQLLIVGVLSLAIILSAPIFGELYHLDDSGVWLIRVLGLAFFLSSLKVVPSVLFERQLNFKPLVLIEVIETIVFNSLLIYLVFQGRGIWSFSIAALARGLVGVGLIYLMSPVKVGLGIEKTSAKKLLSFGIPYQLNSLLALLKDRLVPLVIAKMVGSAGIGYITWAQNLSFLPLEIMNIIIRISFPTFSRLQEDKQLVSRAIERALFISTLAVFPMIFGLGAVLPQVVTHIVSAKWEPAIPSFYLFGVSTLFSVVSTTFTNALNAIGHIKTTLKLMVFWTIITWVLTPTLVYFYGFIGVALASLIISSTSVITVVLIKRILTIKVMDSILLPLVASIVMGISTYYLAITFVSNKPTLFLVIAAGALIYVAIVYLLGRKKINSYIQSIKESR